MLKPLIMGILNITPDSFSDGGQFYDDGKLFEERIADRVLQMIDEGADILDIGGESTGPGSKDVLLEEELQRVIPAVKIIRKILKKNISREVYFLGRIYNNPLISVDTYKAEVARQALEAGADMINDVTAFRGSMLREKSAQSNNSDKGDDRSEMAALLAEKQVPVVIMYAKDVTARTTREHRHYDDVVKTIRDFWDERIKFGLCHGMKREQFILDPGMGAFVSSDPKYSLEILRRLKEFDDYELPILVGASRKGFIGEVLAKNGVALPAGERLEGSLACVAIAVMNGAHIIRAHDVEETRRVVDMVSAIELA